MSIKSGIFLKDFCALISHSNEATVGQLQVIHIIHPSLKVCHYDQVWFHCPVANPRRKRPIMGECAYPDPREGQRVTLKAGAFSHVKIREWTILCHLKNGKILLRCLEKKYTLEVTSEDIENKS